jgi:hypothetical protein
LAACGKTPQKQNDPTVTTTASETTAAETVITETTTTSIYDEIADPSFEGETFTILCRTDMRDEIYSEGESGDVYGDAVFARNALHLFCHMTLPMFKLIISLIERKDRKN